MSAKMGFLVFIWVSSLFGQNLLLPMDLKQTDHLRAYGITYWALKQGFKAQWLLNYRGGAFMMPDHPDIEKRCRTKGVYFEILSGTEVTEVYRIIAENNMESIALDKAPKIAVYTPPHAKPWDDAVTLALTYAEIPYETVWDEQILRSVLSKYDWLHLHHEDFTGQYGKFYASYHQAPWYVEQQRLYEKEARRFGFPKVSKLKLAVAQMIKQYVLSGGFLFAMCSATDSFDIALASAQTDICDVVFDGDPIDPEYAKKLDYSACFAFEKFELIVDPFVYEFSDIDTTPLNQSISPNPSEDYFTLFEFSAKYDPVPCMLSQNHVSVVHNFMGQTSGFRRSVIKPSVVILGEKPNTEEVKYIHGNQGKGTFTFLAGHDPEDYYHFVGDVPTDLAFHKNSPGYRLILNNILFPAARKKEQKT